MAKIADMLRGCTSPAVVCNAAAMDTVGKQAIEQLQDAGITPYTVVFWYQRTNNGLGIPQYTISNRRSTIPEGVKPDSIVIARWECDDRRDMVREAQEVIGMHAEPVPVVVYERAYWPMPDDELHHRWSFVERRESVW